MRIGNYFLLIFSVIVSLVSTLLIQKLEFIKLLVLLNSLMCEAGNIELNISETLLTLFLPCATCKDT